MIHICAIAKRELPYIKDWVEYHLNLGVDRITVYIHEPCLSEYRRIVPHDEVTLVDWSGVLSYGNPQLLAYQHFVDGHQNQDDYTFFIDVDEYVTPPTSAASLSDLTMKMEEFAKDCLLLPWVMCNANGKLEYEDKPVVKRFTTASPLGADRTVFKSFIHNSGFLHPDLHVAKTRRGCVDQAGSPTKAAQQGYRYPTVLEACQANGWWYLRHYFTKSWEEYVQRRIIGCNVRGLRGGKDVFFLHNPDMLHLKEELVGGLYLP